MATTTFDNLITFSRGSNATVTGPNGLIQWAPSNLLTNSQDFEAAGWSKGAGATVVANNQAAPDGTTTADTITFTAGGAAQFVRGFTTMVVGLVYTVSVYARRVSGTPNFIFDIGNSAAVSGTQTLTTDWQWFTFTFTFSGANQWVDLEATAAGSIAFWGAQLELGSTATTYNNTSVRNLLGFSEAFDDGGWSKTRCSIVTGAQANPVNGLFNAQKLMEDTINNNHWMRRSGPAGTYMFSVYAKAAGRSFIQLTGLIANTDFVTFNLATGTVDSAGSAVSNISITPVGDGWYRVAAYIPVNATGATIGLVSTAGAGWLPAYQGDGNSGVYIYGAMLSNSASLDPYVPTPGAAPSSTAYYGPRFDYDPVTLLPRGLLVEEQRTNLVLYSQDFANASWAKSSATVTPDTTAAPDGTTTADTLAPSSSTSGVVERSVTFTGDGDKAVSIFLKAGTSTLTYFFIRDTTVPATRGRALITWTGGVPSVTADSGGTIQGVDSFGNGWYRIRLLAPSVVAANSNALRIQPDAAVGTGTVIAWGAQAENGAFATSYIPTIASTVTRSADVATITGSLFSQWYNGVAGTLIAESTDAGPNTAALFGPSTNIIRVGGGRGQVFVNGSNDANLGSVITTNTRQALAYATNDMAFSANGGAVATDTSCAVPAGINELRLNSGVGTYANGHIRSIRYVPVRAADFQLQQVTT
jgi:hypothetical protein